MGDWNETIQSGEFQRLSDTSLHKTQTSPDDELVEAVQSAIDEWFAGDMKFRQQPIGQLVAQSILPLLASREAAVLEELESALCAPDWSKCLGHVHDALRTLSKGETP